MRLTPVLLLLVSASWLGAQQLPFPVVDTCSITQLPTSGQSGAFFQLPDSLGTFQLTPRTVAGPLGANPDGRKFTLEDSTVIEVWVTPEPVMSLMSTSPVARTAVAYCRATIDGHTAVIAKIAFTKPGGTSPSYYHALANIILDSVHTINVAFTTPTVSSRDETLRLLTLLQLRAPKDGTGDTLHKEHHLDPRVLDSLARRMDSLVALVDTIVVLSPDSIVLHVGQYVEILTLIRTEARRASGEVLPTYPGRMDVEDTSIAENRPGGMTGHRVGRTRVVVIVHWRNRAHAPPSYVPVVVIP